MPKNKQRLHQLISEALEAVRLTAEHAVRQAHETATHEEAVAENKYDTFGLEASYLAAGQAKRLRQAESDIQHFRNLPIRHFNEDDEIGFGAFVELNDSQGSSMHLFVSPVAGGLTVELDGVRIGLVTRESPLGKKLLGASLGDIIMINERSFEITAIA